MKKSISLLIVVTIILSSCHKDEVVPAASVTTTSLKVEASYTSAEISWNIVSNATIDAVVLEYSTDSVFHNYAEKSMRQLGGNKENYIALLDSLAEGTTYYIRCCCVNKINSCKSKIEKFATIGYHLAKVTTDSITNVSISTATINATLHEKGTDKEAEVGFYYAAHPNITENDVLVLVPEENKRDSFSYSYTLINLDDDKTFYVRAFVRNIKGIAWGEELSFKTTEIFLPTVENTTIKDITYTSAICSSNVSSDGGSNILERGFCYSTGHNPTINNNKIKCTTSDFNTTINNLSDGTTYYVRAYARNSKGTAYGSENSFSTKKYTAPEVTTPSVSNITQNTVTCISEVTFDGGQAVTECGFCYSTSHNPTISNNKIKCTPASFTGVIANLEAATKYYVRAYATNSRGTSYSSETSFSTLSAPPIVQIEDYSVNSVSSVTCTGNIVSSGSAPITECGFCWSTTSQNPTVSNSHSQSNLSSQSISANLSGLTPNTIYYVRAYAQNSVGISYSSKVLEVLIPIIHYTGNEKLIETETSSEEGLHTNAFGGSSILLHNFSAGTGSILFNSKLSIIGNRAFYGCRNMTSITLPNTVTYIGHYAFWQCNNLTSISIPNSVSYIGSSVFYNCHNLTTINIPSNITSINSYTFYLCRSLTQINIPQGVTDIGEKAFCLCQGLTAITIPEGVVSIGKSAFYGDNIKSVILPQSITEIQQTAFEKCNKIESITCKAVSPPTCGTDAFKDVPTSIPVYVPSGSVNAYRSALGWMNFSIFRPY